MESTRPDPSFFEQDTPEVARKILGWKLISRLGRRLTGGLIVETEACLADGDPACHGDRGKTRSNAAMFGPAGRAYVYPIHAGHCFNIVTGQPGQSTAVLVRSLHPLVGWDTMVERRGMDHPRKLTTGPSRLCQALGIDRRVDHHDLTLGRKIWLEKCGEDELAKIWGAHPESIPFCKTPRIGVTSAEELRLRFAVRGNTFVSGPLRWRT